ncbi:MAG TPA: DUF2283 domain-containing protein [Candidatus Ratteibacteria bacterium]|nr:DUF2283 domain-containing protein [bacterium]HRR95386.1 DUF2283 domain-containing protein [Candidatus Ratteibacteria bacterium]
MKITYDSKYDVLYLKFKDIKEVVCKNLTDDITIDMDERGKIAGIEILSASKHIDLDKLLPIETKEKISV